jgi:hypothetical protein
MELLMKRLATILGTSILLAAAGSANAENDKNFNVSFGGNAGFGFGPAVDYKVNKNWTVGLARESLSITSGSVSATSSGTGVSARYYFSEALAQGSYIKGSYMRGSLSGKNSTESVSLNIGSVSLTYGKTWMWDNFNLDAHIGVAKLSSSNLKVTGGYDSSQLSSDFSTTAPVIGFSIGYAF